jgi:transcriptional regulator with XRE-family HTH domain
MTDFLDRWVGESDANAKLAAEELLIAEVTEAIWEAMEDANTSKTELAQRMGATKGHVSQVLSGSRNMTLRTLADICHALGLKPAFSLQAASDPQGYRTEPQVSLLRQSSKLRYTKVGNTIYPQNAWNVAA